MRKDLTGLIYLLVIYYFILKFALLLTSAYKEIHADRNGLLTTNGDMIVVGFPKGLALSKIQQDIIE